MKRTLPLLLAVILTLFGRTAGAQTRPDSLDLSLEQALGLAAESSEEVRLARSRVDLAGIQVREARSQALPQINGVAGYTRTFASQFDTGGSFTLPDSLQFRPDPNLSLEERLQYLERATPIAGLGGLGQIFGNLPFGRENAYMLNLSGSQVLYSGGRVGAALKIARRFEDAAEANMREEMATLEVDVKTAYYQALLAEEMVRISEAALVRSERFLAEEQLRLKAGRSSDLNVLRAEVEMQNLRPQLIQARNAAELSMLNLKRLTNIPMTQPIRLTTEFTVPSPEDVEADRVSPEVLAANRASLQAVREQVAIREQQVRIARGSYLPQVSFSTSYGKQLYPSTMFALTEDWRTDWTAGFNVQIPIFDGFRRSSQVQAARVELTQAQLQARQLEESIQLQYEQAIGEKTRALAQIEARQQTVAQADRVYELTVMRYDKGLATQLDVFSAQLALLQARTNLVQALSDYYIADAGVDRAIGTTTLNRPN